MTVVPPLPNAATVQTMSGLLVGRSPLDIEPIWLNLYTINSAIRVSAVSP